MIVSIASGKGGTGKTTVAVNLALAVGTVKLLDCDVEEPNCHIFLKPKLESSTDVTVKVPEIDEDKCTFCGKCARFCQYNALAVAGDTVMKFPALCHSCGGCAIACPTGAIREVERRVGVVESGYKGILSFTHGILDVGEARATPVIQAVKQTVSGGDAVIDAPPGTSCAVIEAVKDSDYCVLVSEPTPFGLNDLKIAVEMLEHLGIPHGVVVNKSCSGECIISEYCRSFGIPVLMRIPEDRRIAELYSEGVPFIEEMRECKKDFTELYGRIRHEATDCGER